MTAETKNATKSMINKGAEIVSITFDPLAPFRKMETIMTNTASFEKITQDAQKAGQEGVEALVEFGTIFGKGVEGLLKQYVALAQSSAEKNAEGVKALLSCKTLNEYAETQNKLAQENLDSFLNNVTTLSELSVKIATDALEPINDQFSKNVKKASAKAA